MSRFVFLSSLLFGMLWIVKTPVLGSEETSTASTGPGIDAHVVNPTQMRFSYTVGDPRGPVKWMTLPGARDTTNQCGKRYATPLNIMVDRSQAIDSRETAEDHGTDDHKLEAAKTNELTLSFAIFPRGARHEWYLAEPVDIYHGLEIKGSALGELVVTDEFDSHLGHGYQRTKSQSFIFHFGVLTYCRDPPSGRSSHQIDGEMFPFEFHMLFFRDDLNLGIDKYLKSEHGESLVMVSVLGKIGKNKEVNDRFQPVADAVKKFEGGSFDDYDDKKVKIASPFSVHWLIPVDSGYFYYDNGTFPIPPCFRVPRVYVIKDPILITKEQLSALTNVKVKSEASGSMPCTFGFLRDEIPKHTIRYNRNPLKVDGSNIHKKKTNRGAGNFGISKLILSSIASGLIGMLS